MINKEIAEARIKELAEEVRRICNNPQASRKMIDHAKKLNDEAEELYIQLANYTKACSMRHFASPHPDGDAPFGTAIPGAALPTQKSFAGLGRSEPKWSPPSPLQASHTEFKQLFDAARHRAGGFQVELGTKAYGDDADIRSKTAGAPVLEGGLGLPSVIQPQLQLKLPYEPDRLFSHFPGVNMDGPSAAFLQHTSNTNPAAAVGENQPKPDLGIQLVEQIVRPTKIAALASASMEALMDYESFLDWIPTELTRALIDAETDQIVNGSGTGANMLGILNVSGLLTRAQGADTPIDALQKSFNDLRVGPAFGVADLIAMHPSTWNSIRRQKTTFNSYILSPDPSTGQVESVFGVRVVVNTHIAAGTAIVFDTSQAVLAWTRLGLTLQVNPYGDSEWVNNTTSFRVEERIAIGVRRPSAVVTVTGLPTS